MFISLLCLGLVASAYTFFPLCDIREIKMTVAILFAISIGMAELYKNGFQPIRNKWLLFLIIYLPISIFLAPSPKINLVGVDVTSFWAWQPFFQIFVFFFLAIAVASHEFSMRELKTIFYVMAWSGFVMSFYVILQKYGMDQFFEPIGHHANDEGAMAGFLGNPTLTAPFVAMTVPFMIYIRKWWMVAVAIIALIFTKSQVAMGAAFVGLTFLFATRGKYRCIAACVIFALAAGLLILNLNKLDDNERFHHWKQIAIDIKSPISKDTKLSYPITGRGLGSFRYIYHVEHPGTEQRPNRFHQAHNEYLEFVYNCGLVGIFIALFFLLSLLSESLSMWDVFSYGNDYISSVLISSFVTIATAALGTFVWQIGTTCFYSAVVVGLLMNPKFKRGVYEKADTILGS